MNKCFIFLLCVAMFLGACNKDNFRTIIENSTNAGKMMTEDVGGLLLDENGVAVTGAWYLRCHSRLSSLVIRSILVYL